MQWLAKAQVQRLNADGSPQGEAMDVMYNPTEYTLSKANSLAEIPVPGLDSPLIQFIRGQSESLTLELFFDSTEAGTGEKAKAVTETTDAFYQLIKIESHSHAPPIVLFTWGPEGFPGARSYSTLGSQGRNGFKGVVESVKQRFTFFSSLGLPLRAILTLTLKEYKTLSDQIAELNLQSPDRTRAHVVQQGQTITRVAELTDLGRDWRAIAEANGIVDPLDLEPGTLLIVPAGAARSVAA
jgi:hypothetical protein